MGAHVGDIGTQIIFDTGESLAGATVHKLVYRKPDSQTGQWEAAIDGTKLIFITTHVTDLDCMGTWNVQAYVVTPGWEAHSNVVMFIVNPNLG